MAAARGSTSSSGSLLDEFLTEYCVFYCTEPITTIQTSEGELAEVPLVVEGVLWDYDPDFLLVGDEAKLSFSILSRKYIAKIDIIDKRSEAMMDPNRPAKDSMN
jgi:hypothetical protein